MIDRIETIEEEHEQELQIRMEEGYVHSLIESHLKQTGISNGLAFDNEDAYYELNDDANDEKRREKEEQDPDRECLALIMAAQGVVKPRDRLQTIADL